MTKTQEYLARIAKINDEIAAAKAVADANLEVYNQSKETLAVARKRRADEYLAIFAERAEAKKARLQKKYEKDFAAKEKAVAKEAAKQKRIDETLAKEAAKREKNVAKVKTPKEAIAVEAPVFEAVA
jgi:hypothetical protein